MIAGAEVLAYNIAFKPVPTAVAGATASRAAQAHPGPPAPGGHYNAKVTTWN